MERQKGHLSVFSVLWEAAVVLTHEAKKLESLVAYEWPTMCEYWNKPEVVSHMNEMKYGRVHFHGCRFGLKSVARATRGQPIKKPWTVATDCCELQLSLDRRCTGGKWHVDPDTGLVVEHAPCSGVNTKITEGYTDEMAKAIHRGHCNHVTHTLKCQLCRTGPMAPNVTHTIIRKRIPLSRRRIVTTRSNKDDVDAVRPFQLYARSQHRGGRSVAEQLSK